MDWDGVALFLERSSISDFGINRVKRRGRRLRGSVRSVEVPVEGDVSSEDPLERLKAAIGKITGQDMANGRVVWVLDGTSLFRETHLIDLARQALAGQGLYWVRVTPRSWKAFVLDGCRACGDGEGRSGRDRGFDGVSGERGEVGHEGVEAVDGKAVISASGGLLGEGVPPFSSAVKPAIRSRGQSDRFSSVRFLTLPPSR